MKKYLITTDLGFGDSGKGTITDYLTRRHHSFLTVRYNGGPQAFHTVYAGKQTHTFRQFGSGSLAGARTMLGPEMVVNPLTMASEARELAVCLRGTMALASFDTAMRLITVNRDSLVVTPFHRALNNIREHVRTARHGSTGMGVGEVRRVSLDESKTGLVVRVSSLLESNDIIRNQLMCLARDFKFEANSLIGGRKFPELDHEIAVLTNPELYMNGNNLVDIYKSWAGRVNIMTTREMKAAITQEQYPVVFEAAQGILLDKHHGFHPYTTWSDTTPIHAFQLLPYNCPDTLVIGITRTYATRHGLGPLVTEGRIHRDMIADDDNPAGTYQGSMRVGCLDANALAYALKICAVHGCNVDQLAVTHCDKMDGYPTWDVCHEYTNKTFVPLRCYMNPQEAGPIAEQFTRELLTAEPVVKTHKTYKVLDELSHELQVPIAIKSFGKSAEHKLQLIP